MSQREWFRFEVNDDGTADIFIFGLIGDWIDDLLEDMGFGFDSIQTAKKFQAELDALPEQTKAIRLHVNSPGGDVWGAVTIANLLRDQRTTKGRKVEALVEGLAASAASIVIQAGDPVRMADNALIMIHDPWTRAAGNARDLKKIVDELDKVKRSNIIATYQWHSELSTEEISDLMEAETWFDADEAVEFGFATEKVDGLKAAASLSLKDVAFLSVPENYRDRVKELVKDSEPKPKQSKPKPKQKPQRDDEPKPAEAAEVLRLCREGGCLDLAETLLNEGATIEEVQARVDSEKKSREAAKQRATTIRGLCEKSGMEELADGYIRGDMDIAEVRSHLTTITAKLGDVGIDTGFEPEDNDETAITKGWEKAFSRANRRYGRIA